MSSKKEELQKEIVEKNKQILHYESKLKGKLKILKNEN